MEEVSQNKPNKFPAIWTSLFNLNMVSTKHQAGFIPNSHRGLPRPWMRIPMHMAVGDGWLGDSRHAHWGGQGEVYIASEKGGGQFQQFSPGIGGRDDLGPGTPKYRYALFIGVSEVPLNYLDTSPVHAILKAFNGTHTQ